ncbi:MAG: CoA transferase, partial [Alphaproteobacteria bacterium]
DIPNAAMASLEDVFESLYLHETGFFQHMEHPDAGAILQMSPPIAFGVTPANLHRPQPARGADGEDILTEAGLSLDAIQAALTT